MKKNLAPWVIALLCLISAKSFSQYVVTPIAPPQIFTLNDLWHFTIVRSLADNNAQFYISLRVFDGQNHLKIKSNTAVIALPTGSHYYNLSNISSLQPFTTSYYDASVLQQVISSGGNFPPGTYNFVYTLYGKSADGEFTPLSENTSEAVVEALWPPMLLSPADGDTIDTQYPILTWTPAFSSSYTGEITYTLKLVELYPGQNIYQAMVANPLYFSQNNIPTTMLPYPPSAQLLDTSKIYVWQVHADAQGTQMGSSEIWSFTWRKHTPKETRYRIKSYFKLSEKLTAEFVYITTPLLPIVTEERYAVNSSSTFKFKILNEQMKEIGNEKKFDATIQTGFNKYLIPVCSSEGKISLSPGKYYLMIELEKNKKTYLAFEIKQGNCHG